MSYVASHPSRFVWAGFAQSLLRQDTGCLQCGAALVRNDAGKTNPSGKCFNCVSWISEDDEVFEDLEG